LDRSLVLLKPDAVQRGLVGELISRLERRGLKLTAMKMLQADEDLGTRHYEAHVDKPFFPGLIEFITSSPLVALVVEGPGAVRAVRALMGETSPEDSPPGTIRGDYALTIGQNLVHGSDSDESAEREIGVFFTPDEVLGYERDIDRWITES
jgi:nucleoside-diphosphate kinase